jgi:membrane carboxypeptidase/penicillin-binding protein
MMQLVKNVFLTNDRKWSRKLMEMILAVLLERQMSKWDILHHYLNKVNNWTCEYSESCLAMYKQCENLM